MDPFFGAIDTRMQGFHKYPTRSQDKGGAPQLNWNQLMLPRLVRPPGGLLNTTHRSRTSLAPEAAPETVVQVCHPPVAGMGREATSGPALLSKWNSSVPPQFPLQASRALTSLTPEPKSTFL